MKDNRIMTIEKVKTIAKEKYGKDLTDEQAAAYIEKYGKLSDAELDSVAGGYTCEDKEYRFGKYCEPCGVWCDSYERALDGGHRKMICPICGTIYS